VRWDVRDDSGRPVPPGLYFVRVQMDGRAAAGEMVVVR
jgi:hypothetical protein